MRYRCCWCKKKNNEPGRCTCGGEFCRYVFDDFLVLLIWAASLMLGFYVLTAVTAWLRYYQ